MNEFSNLLLKGPGHLMRPENKKLLLKNIGNNLKKQRVKSGLTQEKLGEVAGVNCKYIGEIERGEKNPTVVILFKLTKALGISVEALFPENDAY